MPRMTSSKKLVFAVFIDALGWKLAQKWPFLDDILCRKVPLGTTFGYSSTCDPTIITGKPPQEHGHFAFYYYNPEGSPFRWYRPLGLCPPSLINRGRVRSKLSRLLARAHGYTGYFQLYNMPFRYLHYFDYSEKKNIFEPGGITSGAPTFFDCLRNQQIPFSLPDWHLREEVRLEETANALRQGDVAFAYCFLGHLDAVLHAHGTQSDQGLRCVARYETKIRELLALAQSSYDEVQLLVFSDHGMTDVTETLDLQATVDALGLRFGEDYAAVYDSTMARFWFLKDGARDAITRALSTIPEGHIMSRGELASYGCEFPGHRYGQLFFLLNPGTLLCPSFMGNKPLAGMHGYAPDHEDSVACFMTNDETVLLPRRLEDLFGLIVSEVNETGPASSGTAAAS